MTTYTVKPNQSLFDIAIQVYGDVTAVFWLLEDNTALIGVTDRLQVGQVLTIRDTQMNPRQASSLQVFTPFQTTLTDADKPKGLDYWTIEETVIGG